jgi:preprotein translocase subunit SecB
MIFDSQYDVEINVDRNIHRLLDSQYDVEINVHHNIHRLTIHTVSDFHRHTHGSFFISWIQF